MLKHQPVMLMVTFGTIALAVYLYIVIPKGFFPQQDTGRLGGSVQAAQDISFNAMQQKLTQFIDIVKSDPAVESVVGFTGGQGAQNTARAFASLTPIGDRKLSADQVIARLRGKLAHVPGATLYLQAVQDVSIGGRQGNAQYQYTLQGDNLPDLLEWAPKMEEKLRGLEGIEGSFERPAE